MLTLCNHGQVKVANAKMLTDGDALIDEDAADDNDDEMFVIREHQVREESIVP